MSLRDKYGDGLIYTSRLFTQICVEDPISAKSGYSSDLDQSAFQPDLLQRPDEARQGGNLLARIRGV